MATTDTRRTISVREAAQRLGKSPATVRNWCRDLNVGRYIEIPGTKTGYYVLSESEIKWLSDSENQPKMGRPRNDS